ncbi:MAG TPA: histidine phosphatase family protein [Polaromonas sp.]|uniref:histidine phosphatase family protein n=1 Tax=Polaromonas sp. TaxID=1869339 RepID=UPI002D6C8A99|nr:histidine phosphatase family protein [Polaromonas sp.]HYW56165.1 histidine phosphatase family protein [Polaromonas sp.]
MIEPTRIIAIRHGETEWNVNARMQGHLDIALNDTGRWQADRVAQALIDEPITAIYTSDLLRAFDTAQAISGELTVPAQSDTGLRERHFGEFQGRTLAELEATQPGQAMRWRTRDPDYAPLGGESLVQFRGRVLDATQKLVARHPGELIALVTHGGVLDVLYRAATRVELQAARTWALGNASINRLLWTPDGFTLVGWADSRHLDAVPLDETNG